TNHTTDHGVLAHQDHGLATKLDTDLLELVRADMVGVYDQDALVVVEVRFEAVAEVDLALRIDTFAAHGCCWWWNLGLNDTGCWGKL
ncbi:hypothetical protein BVRB_040800, partial [Beta vulgaris subsp. vulgaris]